MWYRFAVAKILLSNPVVGGFWVDVNEKNELGEIIKIPREIKEGQPFGIREWVKLLTTNSGYVSSQEKLNDFLNNPKRFVIRDGKKFYIPRWDRIKLKNPIVGGFWVDEKEKNELGEFVTTPREIKEGEFLNFGVWEKLLSVSRKNFNSQEKLNDFLNDPSKFEIRDGKRFYIPFIPLRNPIENGFWVDLNEINELGEEIQKPKFIPYEKPYGNLEWAKLLSAGAQYINSQEKLNNFLSNPNKFVIRDGRRFYISRWNRKLKNPVIGGFYLGDKPIPFGESFGIVEWSKLLSTDTGNINSQEKLNNFLSDERRFEDKNGVKIYVPIILSSRESLFEKKFNNYNRDSITIQSQQKILISYIVNNIIKKTILKLDFAFIKNNKPILAVEINGMQHYGFVNFSKSIKYDEWQQALNRDILKINYCHDNNIPLLIFHHMLSDEEFKSILNNLYENPNAYAGYIPQPAIDNNTTNTSLEFIKRQIYSHLYPVFNGTITFNDDASKKRYIKDTLILISKLMGIYEGGIDKTDYINSFDLSTDLTSNYNICLSIYNNLYADYPLDRDEKITYSDLSKPPRLQKEKLPEKQKPKENSIPIEERDII